MSTKIIDCVTSEEVVNAIAEVNELMKEIEKLYEPFVGMKIIDMTTEEIDTVRNLMNQTYTLTKARTDLRNIALNKFGIFVF